MNDIHGLSLGTDQASAAEAFNRALRSYLAYRTDLSEQVKAALQADPQFALAHCLKGYLFMLMYNRGALGMAAEAHRAAAGLAGRASEREQSHVRALGCWVAGDLDGALREWEGILATAPRDVLALRLAHFNYFWLGRAAEMRASLERAAPRWDEDMVGYPTLLSCLSFALEETGDYAAAERAGRRAVALDPADVWGTHAVAHVFEMQRRDAEGVAWLDELERHWEGKSSLVHHLWWHRALFHLARAEHDAVLDLYDRRFRNLASPLVAAMPDLYIDLQNAASMLFRLERRGLSVGSRWAELADKAEARIGDCLSAFTLPHWAMALAATGRYEALQRLLKSMQAYGETQASTARVVREVAVPVCQAVLEHRRGEHQRVVSLMSPLMARLHELGASHAQRDVLVQLYRDSEKGVRTLFRATCS
ncbi:MAG TPA: tetratricopeptide repeat protein [Burkholderiales bacterium]|jgi:tetratricopeptide (TPR) repeat protein|nr:tetratricopeptide repeat protein [Burkholderiales bacterium]